MSSVDSHVEKVGNTVLLLSLGCLNGLSSMFTLNLRLEVLSYKSLSSLSIDVSLVVLLVIIIESVSEVPGGLINLLVFGSS